jgi:hypothetical protein
MTHRDRWFVGATGVFLAFVALWTTLTSFSYLRFCSQTIPDKAQLVTRPALSSRVAFVVLDGLRLDRFEQLMPELSQLAQQHGTLSPVRTPDLTFTATGIYTLGTGDVPTLSLLPGNFRAERATVDSLAGVLSRNGKHAVAFGESVWLDLFAPDLEAGLSVRDIGPYAATESPPVLANFSRKVLDGTYEFCLWHDPTFDKLGHKEGIFSRSYEAYARSIDRQLAALVLRSNPEITWIITSDHGMTDGGNHGGGDAQSRASFLATWGNGIAHTHIRETIEQPSIPNLVSALLGVPFPFSAATPPPWHLLRASSELLTQMKTEHDDQKARLAWRLSGNPQKSQNTAAQVTQEWTQAQIERAHRGASPTLLILCLFPFSALIFWILRKKRWWPRSLSVTWLLLALGTLIFANIIYPRVSFRESIGIHFGWITAISIGFLAYQKRSRELSLGMLSVGLLTVIWLTVDAHWVAFIAPLGLVLIAWAGTAQLSPRWRWLAVTIITSVVFTMTVLGWLRYIGTNRYELPSALTLTLGTLICALFASVIQGKTSTLAQRIIVPLLFAALYLMARQLPVPLRPYWPLAVPLAAWGLGLATNSRQPLGFYAALALYSVQLGPMTWCLALALTIALKVAICAPGLTESQSAEERWLLRGVAVLSVGYLWVVAQGNQLDFSDVEVLTGMLGGAVPLHLPLVVALTALHYSAPLVLFSSWPVSSRNEIGAIDSAVRVAQGLFALRLLLHLISFAWGKLAWGTWEKELLECLLLITWFHAALLRPIVFCAPSRTIASDKEETTGTRLTSFERARSADALHVAAPYCLKTHSPSPDGVSVVVVEHATKT